MTTTKTILTLLLLLGLMPTVSEAQVSFGDARKINDDWLFLRVDTAWNVREEPGMATADYAEKAWRRLSLPHDWGVEQPMSPDKGSCQGYLPGGTGWYRRHLTLAPQTGLRYYVYFEGIYHRSQVWLNGHELGSRPSGFAPLLYDLTPWLREGDNVLAVRVDHSDENDSRWYTGSGINRDVWLVTAPEVHLAPWGTAWRLTRCSAAKATLEVDVETTDCRSDKSRQPRLKATVELHDAEGRTVATAATAIGPQQKKTLKLSIGQPRMWSSDQPYLYTLVTTMAADGNATADRSVVRVGLRTLQFSPDRGFALNGQWTKVKGVCLHDDAGVLGTAVPADVWRRRLVELKQIGVNAVRMSHNPHAPLLYDLCDELGLLVMDEASDEWELPKRKWLKGWNQGEPGYEGTFNYFEEWIERDVADMVRRDRCHPSVFMWSIGNEVDYPNDPYSHPVLDGSTITQPMYGGYKPDQPHAERIGQIAKRLAAVVRGIDTSRPVTGALAGVVMSNETEYPQAVDVVGYNYTESRYAEDHKKYADRVIYGSENRHDLAAWKAVSDNDHIFGQFLWTGIDYLGESGVWPARGSSAGLLDLAGQRKPMGWYRAALWSTQPTCYAGTYPVGPQRGGSRQNNQRSYHISPYATDSWNYEPGQQVRVVCYTNATDARLLVNGQPVEAAAQRDADTGILFWDVPFTAGHLRCEASNGAAYDLYTTGRPYALRLSTDRDAINSEDDVVHVFVEVVDEEGRLVKTADNEVTLIIEGGTLLGMENGNMAANHPVRRQPAMRPANRLRVSGGRLVAYVRADGRRGIDGVSVRAVSPLLSSQKKNITSNLRTK